MKVPENTRLRLQFLARVVNREVHHLQSTVDRLFDASFSLERVQQLGTLPDIAERVEAFVGRFGRLQDTLGDKLLPALLTAVGEPTSSAADNLDKAERFQWIASADEWFSIRALRNQMVHEYVEDPVVLYSALEAGHRFTPTLMATAHTLLNELSRRGLV